MDAETHTRGGLFMNQTQNQLFWIEDGGNVVAMESNLEHVPMPKAQGHVDDVQDVNYFEILCSN